MTTAAVASAITGFDRSNSASTIEHGFDRNRRNGQPALYAVEKNPQDSANLIAYDSRRPTLRDDSPGGNGLTTSVPAVVLPVFERYLSALGAHPIELTTLIFGWQGKNQEPARRLVGPERLCRKYGHIPFLFRATETTGKVTHAAIAGLIVHRDQPDYKQQKQFLYESREERFTGAKRSDEVGPHEIGSFYVVAAGMELPEPIAFEALTLLSQGRPLNPKMARGYATVGLPSQLIGWHDEAVRTWDRLAAATSL